MDQSGGLAKDQSGYPGWMAGRKVNGDCRSESIAKKNRPCDSQLIQACIQPGRAQFDGKLCLLRKVSRSSVARPIQKEKLAADRDAVEEGVKLTAATARIVQADDRLGNAGACTWADGVPHLPGDWRATGDAISLW